MVPTGASSESGPSDTAHVQIQDGKCIACSIPMQAVVLTVTCIGSNSHQMRLQRVAGNLVHLGNLLLPIGQHRLKRYQLLNPCIVGIPAHHKWRVLP